MGNTECQRLPTVYIEKCGDCQQAPALRAVRLDECRQAQAVHVEKLEQCQRAQAVHVENFRQCQRAPKLHIERLDEGLTSQMLGSLGEPLGKPVSDDAYGMDSTRWEYVEGYEHWFDAEGEGSDLDSEPPSLGQLDEAAAIVDSQRFDAWGVSPREIAPTLNMSTLRVRKRRQAGRREPKYGDNDASSLFGPEERVPGHTLVPGCFTQARWELCAPEAGKAAEVIRTRPAPDEPTPTPASAGDAGAPSQRATWLRERGAAEQAPMPPNSRSP